MPKIAFYVEEKTKQTLYMLIHHYLSECMICLNCLQTTVSVSERIQCQKPQKHIILGLRQACEDLDIQFEQQSVFAKQLV